MAKHARQDAQPQRANKGQPRHGQTAANVGRSASVNNGAAQALGASNQSVQNRQAQPYQGTANQWQQPAGSGQGYRQNAGQTAQRTAAYGTQQRTGTGQFPAVGGYQPPRNFDEHRAQAIAHRKRQRHKRIRNTIIGVFLVLILAAVGAGAYYLMLLNNALSLGDESSEVSAALSTTDTSKPFYMLVIGSDSREKSGYSTREDESGDNERSDVMLLMRIDQANKKVAMLTIPRDTPWTAPDGSIKKINEAYNVGGAAASIDAVESIVGVKVSHYAEVRFSGFQSLVDTLGGITVDVPTELSYKDALTNERVTLHPGVQTINGQQAQILARARHEYGVNQDESRQKVVRSIVAAMAAKAQSLPLASLPDVVLKAARCIGTDMSSTELLFTAYALRSDVGTTSGTGPSAGGINEACGNLWLCYIDNEGWGKALDAMEKGEDLSKLSYVGDTAIIAGTTNTVTITD